ncbi:MAG: hypothetical protein FWE70_00240 [Oscillospiraceae bacterium]|nr:hypothetical protein [Oscillospiraceae bacterium]
MEKAEAGGRWFVPGEIDDLADGCRFDMSDWLDKPAGKHGFLRSVGGGLAFEDGTPFKIWGSNITEGCVHDWKAASSYARRMARFGMNAVRFHKFTWSHSGIVAKGGRSTDLDPAKADGMDRAFHEFKERGLYVAWSHVFGHQVTAADGLASGFVGDGAFSETANSYGLVNFAEDMQGLVIRLTVNLLTHENPYTGLRYCDDPALAIIELQNEDNIFWGVQEKADKVPHYRSLLNGMFCDWLEARYGGQDRLEGAWGPGALDEGESLGARNIYAHSNCHYLSPDRIRSDGVRKRRYLDCMLFLHETQNAYYRRYRDAIRSAGYKGVILASPWMAGEVGAPHFYNLRSDALIGPVDRHDYWCGGSWHMMKPGPFMHGAMVSSPGSGIIRRAAHRVEGVPFLMSEWMSTQPNEYLTEAPFIVAAYGMGLNGWSGSFSYAIDHVHNIYNANNPAHLYQYPALARMVHRGDVREAGHAALQEVDLEALAEGGEVPDPIPPHMAAVGKVGVRFRAGGGPSLVTAPTEPFIKGGEHRSSTGQLCWDAGGGGMIVVDTPGTAAVMGFVGDRAVKAGILSISKVANRFVNVILTGLGREALRESRGLLLTALARSRFTGMRYGDDGATLLEPGTLPFEVEGVDCEVTVEAAASGAAVYALDGNGRRAHEVAAARLGPEGVSFTISADHEACWYEVVLA